MNDLIKRARDLLRESRDTLRMWQDIDPEVAVGLCLDLDVCIGRLDAHLSEPDALQAAAQPVSESWVREWADYWRTRALKTEAAAQPSDEDIAEAIEREFSTTGEWPDGDAAIVRAFLKHSHPRAATPPAGERSPKVQPSPMTLEWVKAYPKSAAYIINELATRLDAGERSTPAEPNQAFATTLLSAAAKSGDPGAIELAAQLADVPPCSKCGFVKSHCQCTVEDAVEDLMHTMRGQRDGTASYDDVEAARKRLLALLK